MKKEYNILQGCKRLNEVPMSGIRIIMNRAKELSAQGHKVISFSAGEPNFNTPEPIKKATIDAINANHTHYAMNWGQLELRKEIAKKLYADTKVDYNPQTEILITCGGAEAINIAITSMVDPEDEVIIFKPAFINYEALLKSIGAKIIDVNLKPEEGFQFNIEEVKTKITEKTKMIIMNNPNNPAGVVYEKERLEELAKLAIDNNLLIVSDEMYYNLTYGEAEFYSMASFPGMKERTLLVNGFSKTYAMTGWRLGYVAAPKEVMPKLVKNHQFLTTSLPTFIQIGVANSMNLQETNVAVKKMKQEFEKRCALIMEGLDTIELLSYVKPNGAFYIMVDVSKTGLEADEFAERLLYEKYVAAVPGSCFSAACVDYIRISFAASEEDIKEGIRRIKEFVVSLSN